MRPLVRLHARERIPPDCHARVTHVDVVFSALGGGPPPALAAEEELPSPCSRAPNGRVTSMQAQPARVVHAEPEAALVKQHVPVRVGLPIHGDVYQVVALVQALCGLERFDGAHYEKGRGIAAQFANGTVWLKEVTPGLTALEGATLRLPGHLQETRVE